MLRKDFIAKLSEKFDLPKNQTDKMINQVFEAITEILLQNDEIALPGFGKFGVQHKAAHHGRNPRTGEKLSIKAKAVPIFKASSILKETMAKKVKVKLTDKNNKKKK